MIQRRWLLGLAAAAALTATPLSAQQTFYYPAKGQSPERMNKDRGECYAWAVQQTGFDPANPQLTTSTPPSQPEAPQGGVVRGAARGAAAGAAVGAITGDAGKGAAVGAAGGGMVGGLRRRDQQTRQEQERRASEQQQQAQLQQRQGNFSRAMNACMQGRGYTTN